ncbi:hypothetical protein [Streptomyces sp. CA2R106]|uniref:hypothetical protein n=1 Tax=Streptomyces sp. CA2R106 TaxID=3120153 RepID=UPI00300A2B6A
MADSEAVHADVPEAGLEVHPDVGSVAVRRCGARLLRVHPRVQEIAQRDVRTQVDPTVQLPADLLGRWNGQLLGGYLLQQISDGPALLGVLLLRDRQQPADLVQVLLGIGGGLVSAAPEDAPGAVLTRR